MRFIANFTPYFGPKRCIYTVFCKVFTTFLSLADFSSAPTSIFAHLHLNVLLLCTRDLVEKCHTLQSGSQLPFLANRNAELAVPPLFWPVNCIKIGGHVALLSGPTVYSLYCAYVTSEDQA